MHVRRPVLLPATAPTSVVRSAIPRAEPFASAAAAWFWTMAALMARARGERRGGNGPARPCDPDDVIRCLDALYTARRIDLSHARVLRIWGERGWPPDRSYPPEREASRLWHEAVTILEQDLRRRGIVA